MKNIFAVREDPNRPIPKEAYGWRIYALAASAAWASAMFGYDSAFIGGSLALPSFKKSFGLDVNKAAATALSANVVSIFQGGCFFGSILGFPIAEKYGRRWNLIAAGIVFIVGAIVQTVSDGSISMMYAGRTLTGLGVGCSQLVVPIYIAESAPPTIRGRLIGVFEVALQLASLIGFWVNFGVQQNMAPSVSQWRIPFAVQVIPAGLLVLSMIFMIESPRWLVKKGKYAQAQKSLAWVRHLPEEHDFVQLELSEIKAQVQAEGSFAMGRNRWKAAWKEISCKGIRNRVILAMGMKWMQNFAGVNALNYYSPLIFQSVGLQGTSKSLLATGVYGIVKTVFTLVFITWFVDTWGRRPALLTGSIISFVAMFYLGTYAYRSNSFNTTISPDAGAYIALVMIYLYAAAYSFSWNAMPWIFAAEIFPTRIRTLAMLLTASNQWVSQFVVVYATPYMLTSITYGIFYFFGACLFVSGVIVYAFLPETKGYALEQMHLIFDGSIWARKARKDADLLRDHIGRVGGQLEGDKTDKVVEQGEIV